MHSKKEQIRQFVRIVIFFTLFGANLYLNCQYLKVIHETEHMSGMMLGVFLLQLPCFLLFIITDLWLHNYKSRLTAIIVLVATTLAGMGYYLYYAESGRLQVHDINEDFLYLFGLFQSCLFIYLLLATGISHFIKRKNISKMTRIIS
jgi:hypothetical protein